LKGKQMLKPAIMGFARHGLTTAGGFLVAAGYLDPSGAQEAVGALMTLVGLAWSVFDKRARS
jgi:hypothetical protein